MGKTSGGSRRGDPAPAQVDKAAALAYHAAMNSTVEVFLSALLSYFVITDPIGVAMIFHGLTAGKGGQYRRAMAFKSIGLSLGVVLFFAFCGDALLKAVGISMESFRIAGGLLLFYTAFVMVTGDADTVHRPGENPERSTPDISVFPLAFPLVAGPGCLALTILLFQEQHGHLLNVLALLAALLVIFGFSLACFLGSNLITRVLGRTGNDVIKRLLGVLLASLAIEFIVSGIRGLLRHM